MSEFEVSAFIQQLYDDCIAKAPAPLENINQWDTYKRAQLQHIREYLCLPQLTEQYETTPVYTKYDSRMEDDVEIAIFKIDAIRALPFAVHVLKHTQKTRDRAVIILQGHDPQ